MKKGFHKVEHFIDKLIPYLVLILFVIIIITLFFHNISAKYAKTIHLADTIIISVFIIDLIFKFIRVRKIKKFIRLYWIDIIAVFPFYLLIRVIEEIYLLFRLSDTIQESQSLLHLWTEVASKEAGAIEKETGKIIRETEKFGKLSRSGFLVRFLKPLTRIPRLLMIFPYYEKTTGEHHAHDKKSKRK